MITGKKASNILAKAFVIGLALLSLHAIKPDRVSAQVTVIHVDCPPGTMAGYFGCMVPPPPGVNYVKSWGALALAEDTQQWVTATGYTKEDKARSALLSACKAGGQKCQIYLTFLNQCVSVARVSDAKLAGIGKDTVHNGSSYQEAQESALSQCKKDWGSKSCTTTITQCSVNKIER